MAATKKKMKSIMPASGDRGRLIGSHRLALCSGFVLPSLVIGLLVMAEAGSAACPNIAGSSPQRWTWTTLEWTYSGGLSTSAIATGASSWNSRQSFTTVQASTGWEDISITDNTSITGLGEIQVYNYGNGGSACYLKRSVCTDICFNTSRIYYADMRLNNNNIGGAAFDWASYWGLSPQAAVDFLVRGVVAHEIGHVFWLENYSGPANCADPTIMSVNDHFNCALSAPTPCDGNAVAGIYSGWSTVSVNTCGPCTTTGCSN